MLVLGRVLLSIESWLVYRDPYFMAYEIIPILYNWLVFHPLYNLTNQGHFFHCSNFWRDKKKQGTPTTWRIIPGLASGFFLPW